MSASLQRAGLLLDQSRYELAEQEARRVLAEMPEEAIAHAFLARALVEQGKHVDATESAKAAIALTPDEPYCHFVMAQVAAKQDNNEQALSAVAEAVRLDPEDPDYLALEGAILFDMGRKQEALSVIQRGLSLDAEHATCANLRAMILVQLGRREEAGQTIDSVLARDPENGLAHANQGWTYLHASKPNKAMEHFREALRLDPTSEWARAGIVEAMKARNIVYRLMLAYFLWMARLEPRTQWILILGGYFLFRALRVVAREVPQSAPYLYPVMGLYVLFALLSWTAVPVFNLLLRFSKFGRLALTPDDIKATNFLGACLLMVGACCALFFATGNDLWLVCAGGSFGMLIPIAGTFNKSPGPARVKLAIYTGALAAVGVVGFALAFIGKENAAGFGMVFLLGIVGFQWFANALSIGKSR